jgi:hypothetical protein
MLTKKQEFKDITWEDAEELDLDSVPGLKYDTLFCLVISS